MKHSTDIYSFFQIWKDGKIKPTPYEGGDSTLPKGESVIFAFRDRRVLGAEVVITIPDNIPHEVGGYYAYGYDNALHIKEELYIRQEVPLSICDVEIDEIPEIDDFVYDCPEKITGNPFTVSFRKKSLAFLSTYQRREK